MNIPQRHLWAAGLTSTAASFALAGYEFLRSSSSTLFRHAYGVENLPVAMALIPIGVLVVTYIYGLLLSWLGSRKTMLVTTLGSGIVIAGCYVAIDAGSKMATVFLFVFRSAYIVLLIEEYWSFINSTIDQSSAKKLNGPIAGWASIGELTGAFFLSQLAVSLGTSTMLLFSALLCIPAAVCSDIAFRKCGEPTLPPHEKPTHKGHLGLSHFRNPRLIAITVIILSTQVLATVLELNFQGALHAGVSGADAQTAFSGKIYTIINSCAFLLQFIAVPILMRLFSIRTLHFAIPLIHITMAFILAGSTGLWIASGAYILFKSLDYSVFRAAKEIIYIPLPFDVRYRAKEVIDVFGYRFGKGGTSLVITILQRAGLVVAPFFSWIGAGAALVWLGCVIPMTKGYENRHQ